MTGLDALRQERGATRSCPRTLGCARHLDLRSGWPLRARFSQGCPRWGGASSYPAESFLDFFNQAKGRPAKRWEDDVNIYSQPNRSNRDDNDLTSDMAWLNHGGRELELGCYGKCIHKQQTQTTNTTHDPPSPRQRQPTNNARSNHKHD